MKNMYQRCIRMNEPAWKKYCVSGCSAGTPLSQQSCLSVSHGVSQMRESELGKRVLYGCFKTQAGSSGLAGGVTALMTLEKEDIPSQATFLQQEIII